GDELQGIKRGILEHADVLAINKADLSPELARGAKRDYSAALRVLRAGSTDHGGWQVPVTMISAQRGDALPELWDELQRHRAHMQQEGRFEARRKEQLLHWMWSLA